MFLCNHIFVGPAGCWALKGQRWERAEQPQEGKCLYIKKWILAQIEARTQLVSMFVPDKGQKIREKTQPYEGFEGCWQFQQL